MLGCSNTAASDIISFRALDYVELPDYNECKINEEIFDFTIEDLTAIIDMELSANGYTRIVYDRSTPQSGDLLKLNIEVMRENGLKTVSDNFLYYIDSEIFPDEIERKIYGLVVGNTIRFSEKLGYSESVIFPANEQLVVEITLIEIQQEITVDDEDLVCAYYQCANMEEVYNKVSSEARRLAVYDYLMNWVFQNSTITGYPKQKDEYCNFVIKSLKEQAFKNNITWPVFLSEVIGMDEQSLVNDIDAYFGEFLVLKSIIEYEGVVLGQDDYEEMVKKLAKDNEMTYKTAYAYFEPIDVYYEIMEQSISEIFYSRFLVE